MSNVNRRASLISLASTGLLLAACANGYRHRDASGQYVPVPVADFKLRKTSIVWSKNAQFPISIKVVAMGNPGKVAMQATAKTMEPPAKADMALIQGIFSEEVQIILGADLKQSGVEEGDEQVIVVTPVSGLYSGAEREITLLTTVLDRATKKRWQYQVSVTSGPLVSGPHNNKPTNQYVRDYVEAIMGVFKDGRLIG